MTRKEKAKSDPQSTVRIYAETKKAVQEVVRKKADLQKRRVTEIEEIDPVVARWARREKRKLGI